MPPSRPRSPRRFRPLLAVACLWAAAGLTACGEDSRSLPLLDVETVAPETLEPGAILRIEGAGFPVAEPARVRVQGTLSRPGEAVLEVDAHLHGLAQDERRVEVNVDHETLRALGGRGSFRGQVDVSFRGARPDQRVHGSLEGVELDLRESPDEGLRHALALGGRAQEALEEVGLTPADENRSEGGLRVAEVREGSPAARASIQADDVILRANGVRVFDLADLAPPHAALLVELELERPGISGTTTLSLPLSGPPEGREGRVWLLLVLLGGFVVFAACAPATAGPFAALARRPRNRINALDWLLGLTPLPPGSEGRIKRRRVALRAGALLSASLAFAGIASAGRVFDHLLDTGALTGLALALRLAMHIFRPARQRVRILGSSFLLRGLPMALTVLAMLILSGTNDLHGLQAAQGGALWELSIFRNPIAFGLFPVFAITALTGPSAAIARTSETHIVAAMARAHLLVVASLGAVVFLGGWHPITLSGRLDPSAAAALGVLGFALKAWGLLLLGLRLRAESDLARESPPGLALPASFLGVVAAVLWVGLGVPSNVEAMSGKVLLATSLAILAITFARRRRRGTPGVQLHPFL